jgi:hypothetical protein
MEELAKIYPSSNATDGTDKERVMETIFKPVWWILKSVPVIRGQNSNESPLQLRSSG